MSSKSSPRVARYGVSWLGRGANPGPGNLVSLVQRFDPVFAEELSEFFGHDDELLKRDVAFLVDARNKIAHGRSESVRARRALDLSTSVHHVAEWFIQTFDPR